MWKRKKYKISVIELNQPKKFSRQFYCFLFSFCEYLFFLLRTHQPSVVSFRMVVEGSDPSKR